MNITFEAFGLKFQAEVIYSEETKTTFWAQGEPEFCEITKLSYCGIDAEFLLNSSLVDVLEREALLAARAALKQERDDALLHDVNNMGRSL